MPIPKDKVKFSLWVHPQTLDKVEANYKKENSISRSDFIEKAIEFYCEYLASEDYEKYFSKVVAKTMGKSLSSLENRIAKLLFKLSVEEAMLCHVIAVNYDIDDDMLHSLRAVCVQGCKNINGAIYFKDAVKFQRDPYDPLYPDDYSDSDENSFD